MTKIKLLGLPPSANELRRLKIRDKCRLERWYKEDVNAQVSYFRGFGARRPKHALPTQPARVEIVYILGPKSRTSDPVSNREKMLLDALKYASSIGDDRHVRIGEITAVNGPEDMTLVKLLDRPAPTLEQIAAWWDGDGPETLGEVLEALQAIPRAERPAPAIPTPDDAPKRARKPRKTRRRRHGGRVPVNTTSD